MARRRLRLHLCESSPRPLGPAIRRQGLGIMLVGTLVGTTIGWQSWRPTTAAPLDDTLAARWLAPLMQRTARATREDHVEFVGLGGLGVEPAANEPSRDAGKAQAVQSSEVQGERTVLPAVAEEESPRAFTVSEVDSAAVPDPNGVAPEYPATLLALRVEGVVVARFVVDTNGRVDMRTFALLEDSDPEFVSAVKAALPKMRYRPAVSSGKRVPQLNEQRFSFRISAVKPPPPSARPSLARR